MRRAIPASAITAAASSSTRSNPSPIARAQALFGAEHANVQSHSGAQANFAAYFALMTPGDTALGMELSHGGHLTHGLPVNFSGRWFNFVSYGVDPESERIDYDAMARLAREHSPEGDCDRRHCLPPPIRLRPQRRDRRRRGGHPHGGHGPYRGTGGGGTASLAGGPRGRDHLHHPQDAARPALGLHSHHGRPRLAHRPRRLSRHLGRAAHAHHRRQGGRFPGSRHPRLPRVLPPHHRQRPGPGGGAAGRRAAPGLRRHRQPPPPGGCRRPRLHRQAGGGGAGSRRPSL